ncbi:MAG: hypothetical protein CVV27_18185 [Candidatus Melainabacteria bacterium HGW-Melainabacteria-1]|nr:MAG: hypothetical protein CVV27_18185 [Candidatus Melainabacteria bacterium HGW-Melainabacteria-1]
MHPQTYMAGDVPQPVQMSLKSLLPGSRVLSSSVWGELSYRQFLGHHLGWKDAKAAAEGWQGDRYEVLETPDGLVFAFFSLWDDEAEAEAFFASWRKALAVRSAAAMPAAGGTVDIGQKRTWAEIKGRGVAIVESLSVAQTARISAIAAAWREASSQSVPLSQPLRRPD